MPVLARFFLICLFAMQALPAVAQPLQQDERLHTGRLSNGLTWYIYPNSSVKGEVVYRLFLKTGSLTESEEQRGLAHFLEHMAFNGSTHFPKDSLVRFLQNAGARFGKDFNAHTSYNETVFKLTLTADSLMREHALTVLSDWAGGLTLDSSAIEKERGVVLSEWLSKQKGGNSVEDIFLDVLLNGSRFSERRVIGDTAVLRNFNAATLRDYYDKWYDPSLMAVAVAGDVAPEEMKEAIVRKFSSLPSARPTVPEYGIPPYRSSAFHRIFHPSEKKIELHMMQLLPKGKPLLTEKDYHRYLERNLLNQLMRNRFRALAFAHPPYTQGGMRLFEFLRATDVLSASATLDAAHTSEGIEKFIQHLQQMRRYGFSQKEVQRVKDAYRHALTGRAAQGRSRSSESIMNELYAGFYSGIKIISDAEALRLFDRYAHQTDSVSLKKLLQRYVDPGVMQFIVSGYEGADSLLPEQTALQKLIQQAWKQPVSPLPAEAMAGDVLLDEIPVAGVIDSRALIPEIDARTITLSNGARVIFRRSVQGDDRVAISAFRKGGHYAVDPKDYISSQFAASVVAMSGAGKHTRQSLSDVLNGQSASIRFLIDKTRSGIAGSARSADAEQLFQLMYLRWTAPNADSSVFGVVKNKAIAEVSTRHKTAATLFGEEISRRMNGEDYTTREWTAAMLLKELTYDKMLPLFGEAFGSARGYTFVVVSDMPEQELEELAVQYIGALPDGRADTGYRYVNQHVMNREEHIRDTAGTTPKASVVLIYQDTVLTDSYNRFQLKGELMASVIRMKLLSRLREELGMIYSIQVASSSTLQPAPLTRQTIRFVADPGDVSYLIQEIDSILKLYASQPGLMEQELADVKRNLLREMEMNKQKDIFWTSFIRNSIFFGDDDWSYPRDFEQYVAQLSAEDVSDLIRRYFLESKKLQAVQLPERVEQAPVAP